MTTRQLEYKTKFKLEEGHRLTKYLGKYAFRCYNKIVEVMDFEQALSSNIFVCPRCHKCVRKL